MYYKESLIRFAVVFSICAVFILASSPLNPAKCAEQVYDITPCVAATVNLLVQSPEITISAVDAKGIIRSNSESKIFNNCTVHVQGVQVIEGTKRSSYSHMKYLDPDGDYVIFRFILNPGETTATTTILAGTGKWKGITGGGKVTTITQGRPVAEGTFQFCNDHKGKFTLPK
jgi:hypothetical protein